MGDKRNIRTSGNQPTILKKMYYCFEKPKGGLPPDQTLKQLQVFPLGKKWLFGKKTNYFRVFFNLKAFLTNLKE